MTLIIGLLCSDGVVVGADGAATYGVLGQSTIRQTTEKLSIIGGKVIMGSSGPVGLGQRHQFEMEGLWLGRELSGKKPIEAMGIIRTKLFKHTREELEAASIAKGVVGENIAGRGAICYTLIAGPVDKRPCLFQFDYQCAPEMATEKLPFIAIGGGQHIADPFLAFLRDIFWKERQPNLSEGIFMVLWTLTHAIKTTPGGVSDPIQIAVLSQDKRGWNARILPKDETQEHDQFIGRAEDHLRDFSDILNAEPTRTVPQPEPQNKQE